MGRYRDHRQSRSRGKDGYEGGEYPEPSFFQQRATAVGLTRPAEVPTSAAEDAEVRWFNAGKGFGFVRLSDGSDAFLHGSRLQAAGYSDLPEGSRLRIRTEIGPKGPQVAEVLSVSLGAKDARRQPVSPASEPPVRPDLEEPESVGIVKWYDPIKGFGFINIDDGDVFVHATALARSGISTLAAGEGVLVRLSPGRKGIEVQSIRLR